MRLILFFSSPCVFISFPLYSFGFVFSAGSHHTQYTTHIFIAWQINSLRNLKCSLRGSMTEHWRKRPRLGYCTQNSLLLRWLDKPKRHSATFVCVMVRENMYSTGYLHIFMHLFSLFYNLFVLDYYKPGIFVMLLLNSLHPLFARVMKCSAGLWDLMQKYSTKEKPQVLLLILIPGYNLLQVTGQRCVF